ncbi:MAG: diguanylate cyclase [Cyanobacteria bacterium]|nr:diguanylate cyclase [Cyanobacteriota bacterium]MDW8200354.1 diguanylate cyclase [Cyanobacteriota bacterium SKYGB_h_bin112]
MDDCSQELARLRQQVETLSREKAELECVLETVIAHSDVIERQLYQTNQSLQNEIVERQRVEAKLRDFLQSILQEKADLELILDTVNIHGDNMMEFLYEKFLVTAKDASTDALTQLSNRRCFDEYLHREWRRLARINSPLTLLICDVDYFKAYNDTYGHTMGDQCLQLVAQAIRSVVNRSADLVARYGGEEFAVILPEVSLDSGRQVAEKIQLAIAQLCIAHSGSNIHPYVTLSIGVSCQIPTSELTPLQLTIAADRALYLAKHQGRNCIVCYEEGRLSSS